MNATLSNHAFLLKRGDTMDIECHRTTHRLRLARTILHGLGIEPTVVHCEMCIRDRGTRNAGMCWSQCQTIWGPSWVTDAMFQHAWDLADAVSTERGAHNQAEASRLSVEAADAARRLAATS